MKINWENMSHSEQMDTQAMLYPFCWEFYPLNLKQKELDNVQENDEFENQGKRA